MYSISVHWRIRDTDRINKPHQIQSSFCCQYQNCIIIETFYVASIDAAIDTHFRASAILLLVTAGNCETWILKETIINKLFERKILRNIFGPNNENGIWRIKTNQELDEIIKRKNIINFIRAQRLSWLGHIERMQGTRMVKVIYCWNPISRRPTGRPKTRWGGWC